MVEPKTVEKTVRMIRQRLNAVKSSIGWNHAEWQNSRKHEWSHMVTHHETVIAMKVREAKFLKTLLNTLEQA